MLANRLERFSGLLIRTRTSAVLGPNLTARHRTSVGLSAQRMYTIYAQSRGGSGEFAHAGDSLQPKGPNADRFKVVQGAAEKTDAHQFDTGKYFSGLQTKNFGQSLLYAPLCPSTQSLMLETLPALPVDTVVVADAQEKGKGRGTNVWNSPPGQLSFSFKCSLSNPKHLVFVQYLVSLCVVQACHAAGGSAARYGDRTAVRMKWPNDIYADRQKIGGILCNSAYDSDRKVYTIVCGVGLNVFNSRPTTCLADLWSTDAKSNLSREKILSDFANIFEESWQRFSAEGFEPFMSAYLEHWLHTDEELLLQGDGGTAPVRVKGLTASGYLLGVGADGSKYELHPDQNSLDLFRGLLKKKM